MTKATEQKTVEASRTDEAAVENQKERPEDYRNVEVVAERAHGNMYGEKFDKEKGANYLHPRPAADIANGIVSLKDKPAK